MIRPTLAAALLAAACVAVLAPRTAGAQACAGSTIDIEVRLPDGDDDFILPQGDDAQEFFNIANCECNTAFAARLHLPSGDDTFDEDGSVWVGSGCDEIAELDTRRTECEELINYPNVVDDLRSEVDLPIGARAVMFPNQNDCQTDEKQNRVYLLVEDDIDNDTNFLCQASADVDFDTRRPTVAVVGDNDLNGGESSIVVDWALPSTGGDDIKFFQFLCAREDGTVVESDGFGGIDREFVTARDVCPGQTTNDNIASGLPGELPSQLLELSSSALCGTASSTETQIRIEGLENGVEYHIVMVTIDDSLNGAVDYLGTATPKPVRDFWEDYKEKGGGAEGGVCLFTSTYGGNHPITEAMREFRDGELARAPLGAELTALYYRSAATAAAIIDAYPALRPVAQVLLLPVVAVAYAWQTLGTAGLVVLVTLGWLWRARRRLTGPRQRLLAAGAAAACVLLWSLPSARAQSSYDPYWEAWDDDEVAVGPAIPHWNVELKIGPYLPDIDGEDFDLMANEGTPFDETFRGKGLLLFGIELQRFFLFPEGQLGAYASAGIMGRSTNAFQIDSSGEVVRDANGNAVRAPGNKTRFRMIPMSVGAVYRFTGLDERLRIPLVPYGKAGLSYYLWWIREPNGGFARAQKDPDCMPSDTVSCPTTRGLGASIGVQASVGLSVRAERIDTAAAANLRNEMGIEHAGFFVELLYANVDHFGADDRLSVGDLTWLAGLNFEF